MVIKANIMLGTAFDVGQTLSVSQRNRLYEVARSSGVWAYVEPQSVTPSWVHFDKRFRNTCLFNRWVPVAEKREFE